MSARTRTGKEPKSQDPMKVKKQVYLSPRAAKALEIHATMSDQSLSDTVEMLIREHCRRWVVSDRGGPESADPVPVAA